MLPGTEIPPLMEEIAVSPNVAWKRHNDLDRIFNEALSQRIFSGASLLIGTPEAILYEKTWGHTQWGGSRVDLQTRFDLASLTKPLSTAVLYMGAVSTGKIKLDDPLAHRLPSTDFSLGKSRITFRQLLSHSSGLPPYVAFYKKLIALPWHQRTATLRSWILATPLLSEPGKAARYSDLGFILLGMLLERILDMSLLVLSSQWLQELALCSRRNPLADVPFLGFPHFQPLTVSMDPTSRPEKVPLDGVKYQHSPPSATSYRLSDETASMTFAATEYCPWRKRLLRGEVHDENAYTLGGIAGHAGLFGTAREVYHLLSLLWRIHRGDISDGPCSPETIRNFWTRSNRMSDSTWALGYDTPSASQSSAGNFFSTRSVGHLGFTGTSFWLDLEKEILVILLTNRVYPTRQNEKLRAFRPLLHNLIMESINGKSRH